MLDLEPVVAHVRKPLELARALLLRLACEHERRLYLGLGLIDARVALPALVVELLHLKIAILHLDGQLADLLLRAPLQLAQLEHDRLLLGVCALRGGDQHADLRLRIRDQLAAFLNGGVVVEARAPAVIYVRLELAICRELLAEQLLPFVDLIAQDLLAAHRAPHHGLRRLLSNQLDRRRPLERVDVHAVGALARRLALLPQIAILLLKL